MKRVILMLSLPVAVLTLAGCSEASSGGEDPAEMSASGYAAAEAAPPSTASSGAADAVTLALPKMAYVFDYAFRLPGERIATLQQKHADLCEAQGPGQCRILALSRSGEADAVAGELQLAVVAEKARAFGTLLSATTEASDGEVLRADIAGEELSKVIVDTEARLRTRIALRDRLMEVLKTRRGKVEELVEAERGVAQVNEEIDQARSWLAESRGRVAYSRMTLRYEAANPGGAFTAPIKAALSFVGPIAGTVIGFLLVIAPAVGPFLAGILAWRLFARRRQAAEA